MLQETVPYFSHENGLKQVLLENKVIIKYFILLPTLILKYPFQW
jgi:hypothetical protein